MSRKFETPGTDTSYPNAPHEVLRRENDFVINYIKIVAFNGAEYDITNHKVMVTYEESFFPGNVHGSITLIDTVDYPTLLPMIGEERLKASFTRQAEDTPPGSTGDLLPPIEFDCRIYKISPREQQGEGSEKMQTYTLYFCSDEIVKSAQTKVFKAFKAKPFSDIVQIVYDEKMKVTKEIEVEKTKYDVDYAISNQSPIQAIKQIAKRSIPEDPTSGRYFTLWEDRDKFHFKNIGTLFQNPVSKKIVYKVQQVLEDKASGKGGVNYQPREIEKDINAVQHYNHSTSWDILAHLQNGKASSKAITIDIVRQKIDKVEFDLDAQYEEFPHLGNAKPFTAGSPTLKCPDACFNLISTNKEHDTLEHIASREPGIKPNHIEEYLLHRQSNAQQLLHHVTAVQMSGDPRTKVGDIIEFVLPELLGKVSKQNPQELDKYLQGKYIVGAIAHIITATGYYMNMELIKESYFSDIQHRDPVKEYENVF